LKINFQGFLLGNPWTDAAIDNYGTIFFWYNHALISEDTFNGINTTCDYGSIGAKQSDPVACNNYLNQAGDEIGDINPYDIYVDVCLSDEGQQLVDYWRKANAPLNRLSFGDKRKARDQDPCIEDYLASYLNQPSVQKAIFVNSTIWVECSNSLNYSTADVLSSIVPLYPLLLQANIKIWIIQVM